MSMWATFRQKYLKFMSSAEPGHFKMPPSWRDGVRGSALHKGEGMYAMMVRLGAKDPRREREAAKA